MPEEAPVSMPSVRLAPGIIYNTHLALDDDGQCDAMTKGREVGGKHLSLPFLLLCVFVSIEQNGSAQTVVCLLVHTVVCMRTVQTKEIEKILPKNMYNTLTYRYILYAVVFSPLQPIRVYLHNILYATKSRSTMEC